MAPSPQRRTQVVTTPLIYRDELIEDRGLVYKGAAVLVPVAARDKILQKLHRANQGAAKMILLARDTVF